LPTVTVLAVLTPVWIGSGEAFGTVTIAVPFTPVRLTLTGRAWTPTLTGHAYTPDAQGSTDPTPVLAGRAWTPTLTGTAHTPTLTGVPS
jgi:hypothetical protein